MPSGQIDERADDSSDDAELLLVLSVIAFMGAVLVANSLGGVFKMVVLETRQRTREIAVLKAVRLDAGTGRVGDEASTSHASMRTSGWIVTLRILRRDLWHVRQGSEEMSRWWRFGDQAEVVIRRPVAPAQITPERLGSTDGT